jgi:hypothetical protein
MRHAENLRSLKMAEPCETTLRNRRRNANESLVENSDKETEMKLYNDEDGQRTSKKEKTL